MFWFRTQRPPLTTHQRLDIELLMRRSIERIGEAQVRQAAIVTELKQFALDSSNPQRCLESASIAVLGRLPPMHEKAGLTIGDGTKLGYPAIYRPSNNGDQAGIVIAAELLTDPLRTVMELAYQYSAHYWHIGEGSTALDVDPRTTHLLPICCGLGILASDASLYDQQWSQAGYAGWSISRSGYYTAAEIGYALALWSRFRGEVDPVWVNRLRLDSRFVVNQSERYFAAQQQLGKSLLFDATRVPSSTSDTMQLAQWLTGEDPSFALAAAHALRKHDEVRGQAAKAVLVASRSQDRDLAPIATLLLGRIHEPAPEIQQRLVELFDSRHPPTAHAAIESANTLGMSLFPHRAKISRLLDRYAEDPFRLLVVIGGQGHEFVSFEKQICRHLGRAIRRSDSELASALLGCLCRIAEHPRRTIESGMRNRQLRDEALRRLESSE